MPWKIEERDEKFCVVKRADGKVEKCFDDRKAAADHMSKLDDEERATSKSFSQLQQDEVDYTVLSSRPNEACAACRWFKSYGDEYNYHSACHIVNSWPEAIEPTGWCNRFEMKVPYEETITPMPVVIVSEGAEASPESKETAKSTSWSSFLGAVRGAFGGKKELRESGFKVFDDGKWVGWWTNTFKDRDGEHFPGAAIDAYIDRVDGSLVPLPQLWFWHTPGTKHGEAQWLGRVGQYCVAVGQLDEGPIGELAKAYYKRHGGNLAMSHGFTYNVAAKKGGVYHEFNTFELSTLPPRVAANPYTKFEEVKEMALSQEKRAALEAFLGKERAAQVIAQTEAASKAIEDAGVAYKDFTDPEPPASPAPEAVDRAEAGLKELIGDVMTDSAEAVRVTALLTKAFETLKADSLAKIQEALEIAQDAKTKVETIEKAVELRPRSATRASETRIEDPATEGKLKETLGTRHPFTGLLVAEE